MTTTDESEETHREQRSEGQNNDKELRTLLCKHFSPGELETLCADLSIEYHNVLGQTKEEKARELVSYVNRHGRIAELLVECKKLRPRGNWPDTVAPISSGLSSKQATQPISLEKIGQSIIEAIPEEPVQQARLKPLTERPAAGTISACKDELVGAVQKLSKVIYDLHKLFTREPLWSDQYQRVRSEHLPNVYSVLNQIDNVLDQYPTTSNQERNQINNFALIVSEKREQVQQLQRIVAALEIQANQRVLVSSGKREQILQLVDRLSRDLNAPSTEL